MPINVINEHRSKLAKQYFFAKILLHRLHFAALNGIVRRMIYFIEWFDCSCSWALDSMSDRLFQQPLIRYNGPASLSFSLTHFALSQSVALNFLSLFLSHTLSFPLSLSLSNGRRVSQTYSHAFSPSLSYTLQVIYSLNLSLLPKASLPPSPSLARTLVASCHDSHT